MKRQIDYTKFRAFKDVTLLPTSNSLFPALPKNIPNDLKIIREYLPKNLYTYLKKNYENILLDCKDIFNTTEDDETQIYKCYLYFEHIAPNLMNSVFNIMCDAGIFIVDKKFVLIYNREFKNPTNLTAFLIESFLQFFEWIFISNNYGGYKKGLWFNYLATHMIFIQGKHTN